jgi:hypothetical protein
MAESAGTPLPCEMTTLYRGPLQTSQMVPDGTEVRLRPLGTVELWIGSKFIRVCYSVREAHMRAGSIYYDRVRRAARKRPKPVLDSVRMKRAEDLHDRARMERIPGTTMVDLFIDDDDHGRFKTRAEAIEYIDDLILEQTPPERPQSYRTSDGKIAAVCPRH